MLLIVVDACFVAVCLATGLLISYVFRDFSKRPGFVRVPSAFGHCLIGVIVGVLLFPTCFKWESDTLLPFVREFVGCAGFLCFTSRNARKHTRNLRHNMDWVNEKCKTDIEYSLFRSSVTRQQMQFGLGMGLSVLVFACVLPDTEANDTVSIAFYLVATFHVLLGLIQLIAQHDTTTAYAETRDKFHGLLKWLHTLEDDGDGNRKIFTYTYEEHVIHTPFADRLHEEKEKVLAMGFDVEGLEQELVVKFADGARVTLGQIRPEILQQHFPVTVMLAPPISSLTGIAEERDSFPTVVPDFVLMPMLIRSFSANSAEANPEFA